MARGTMPARSLLTNSRMPMVNVLPVPVWPYAKIVPLKPRSTSVTTGRATLSYTSSCAADGPNA